MFKENPSVNLRSNVRIVLKYTSTEEDFVGIFRYNFYESKIPLDEYVSASQAYPCIVGSVPSYFEFKIKDKETNHVFVV
jgi:hypothetical protein